VHSRLEPHAHLGDAYATIRKVIETTGAPRSLILNADRSTIRADGQDVASVTVSALDAQARAVPIANNRIDFSVSGAGKLIGVGNGDPSSHERDHATTRTLFNGLALAIVQSDVKPGTIEIVARSKGLQSARLILKTKR